jgi:hypothetical protein
MIPVGLLIIMASDLIKDYYGKYVVSLLGMWLAAFLITAFSNIILLRCKIIYHIPPKVENTSNTIESPKITTT